ncbi:hypothetical protein [Planococcus dechangensis]|uniref:Uncharacterized protein n=1 Tax=Planococcus dechangensis TaxID=1176255 RepID=A0ABV9MAT7_9BACL
MSEKVILTQKQAELISQIQNADYAVDLHSKNELPYPNLKSLGVSQLARALYVGYEIRKPKFNADDKVVNVYSRKFSTGESILSVVSMDGEEYSVELSNGLYYVESALRHATPEEIYWLHELDRDDIAEFHAGDIIISSDFGYPYKVDAFTNIGHTLSSEDAFEAWHRGNIKGIYPAESFKPFDK